MADEDHLPSSVEALVTTPSYKGNYYLDFNQTFDGEIAKVCSMSTSTPSSITSTPQHSSPSNLSPLPVAPPDPRLHDPAHDSSMSMSSAASENTVVDVVSDNKETWTNTFESNNTDTSVEEPRYAKVTHRKRNSKIASGNSTPRVQHRKQSDIHLSRENSSKFDRNSVQIQPSSSPAPLILPHVTDKFNNIETPEVVEETPVDRTLTDKATELEESLKSASDCSQQMFSSLYANILVIFGLILPLTKVGTETERNFFEIFYIFLYLGSLLFLIFVFIDLLFTKTKHAVITQRKRKSLMTVKESLGDSGRSSCSTGRLRKESQLLQRLPSDLVHADSFASSLPQPRQHYGNFYLRLGTVLFGIGSLIYIGIEMGGHFEVGFLSNNVESCGDMFNIFAPTLHIALIFFQMYFIFLNQKMSIYRRKFVTRIGLMHLVATNICVWIKVVVQEVSYDVLNDRERKIREADNTSFFELSENDLNSDLVNEEVIGNSDANDLVNQQCNNMIMTKLKADSTPYLYPCLVQFCLICIVMLLVMWRNVSVEHEHYKLEKLKLCQDPDRADYSSTCQRYSINCNGSNIGLFGGVMVIIAVIVSLIMFFVFITNPDPTLQSLAIQISSLSQLVLYSLTSVAVMMGMCQMSKLSYDASHSLQLDTLLLLSGQAGVLLCAALTAIGSLLQINTCLLPFLASITTLIQTVLQTAFIIDASRRFVSTPSHIRHKPGRQLVTFLLVCNLAMWIHSIFQSTRSSFAEIQNIAFIDEWTWSALNHIATPLAIFYRFHSATCLYEVWKTSFKFKAENIDFI